MASRDLNDLGEAFRLKAERFESLCLGSGFDVLIYCTYRTLTEQAILFRQGRAFSEIRQRADELEHDWKRPDLAEILLGVGPQHGRKVTFAAPGQSAHNYSIAFDGCPLVGGKPVWGTSTLEERDAWNTYGELAESAGMAWAGRWFKRKEFPHCQERGFDWRDLIGDAHYV